MRKFLKTTMTIVSMLLLIGIIGASKPKENPDVIVKADQAQREALITSRALIQEDFSGLEVEPIVKAFASWTVATVGDITVNPPTEQDAIYFDLLMNDSEGNVIVFEMDLKADGSNPQPWGPSCRHTFYVLRLTSRHPVVKMLDRTRGGGAEILAFTFSGCKYKFIAVVGDRMRDQNLMYTTMMHELGHMWGLVDNNAGPNSIMNGSWPGAMCITKKDVKDLYELYGRGRETPGTGCDIKKDN